MTNLAYNIITLAILIKLSTTILGPFKVILNLKYPKSGVYTLVYRRIRGTITIQVSFSFVLNGLYRLEKDHI